MPLRERADRFLTGSFRALPSCMDADFKSPSRWVAKSIATACVRLKLLPAIFVKVRSWAVASLRIFSSPKRVVFCRSEA